MAHSSSDAKGMSEKLNEEYDIGRVETGTSIAVGQAVLERESTRRGIKSRHAQMIAIGGTIGTSVNSRQHPSIVS